MQSEHVVPGQNVTVPADPNGWPYRVTVGGTDVTAWPEKYRDRRGLKARLSFKVPELGSGTHQIIVHDRNGAKAAGSIQI